MFFGSVEVKQTALHVSEGTLAHVRNVVSGKDVEEVVSPQLP